MSCYIQLLPGALPAMAQAVEQNRCVTLTDRYGLMAAVFDESLPDEERRMVNRILKGIQAGHIQVM
ncbi:MAG: hypothetical protein F6J87_25495 [Spirulina sp. SIO3F2]|nr:hypothetical protein [Spirulina sp. SIO3F2]